MLEKHAHWALHCLVVWIGHHIFKETWMAKHRPPPDTSFTLSSLPCQHYNAPYNFTSANDHINPGPHIMTLSQECYKSFFVFDFNQCTALELHISRGPQTLHEELDGASPGHRLVITLQTLCYALKCFNAEGPDTLWLSINMSRNPSSVLSLINIIYIQSHITIVIIVLPKTKCREEMRGGERSGIYIFLPCLQKMPLQWMLIYTVLYCTKLLCSLCKEWHHHCGTTITITIPTKGRRCKAKWDPCLFSTILTFSILVFNSVILALLITFGTKFYTL